MRDDKTPAGNPGSTDPTPEQLRRIDELYLEASALRPDKVADLLDARCGDDPLVRAEVEELLRQASLDTTALQDRIRDPDSAATGGKQIGPYRLQQKIGEGGMGEVWLAEQTEPVRRRVALKVIKRGMDTRQVIARFEAERQALALMDHPCVAKVFDAGKTPRGRPYFVMEHVQGVPITEHCDRQRLTTQERLDLFREVCEGVQHAHHKAIIHRDLKPSNVLVSYQDGKSVPKIIDFGVAKATAQRLTEKTLFTEMGVLIGTPEYMSPEQAEMTGQDIDTRTDVYSLGVMLYELLTGALPFDPKQLRKSGFEGICRKIREDEPSKPSTRLSTLGGDRSTESAKRRRTDLPTLQRQLRGDLDWITMRALEKNRARRYGSPAELAADIERHLKNEPVVAGPPSTAYRTRKFVQRHRVGVGVAAVGAILLLAFGVRDRIQSLRVAVERDRANEEAAAAKQASAFLADMLGELAPSRARGSWLSAKDILDSAVKRAEQELTEQPLVRSQILSVVGRAYKEMGHEHEAVELFRDAHALTEQELGREHEDTIARMETLAWGYEDLAVERFEEAEVLRKKILEARARDYGWKDKRTLYAQDSLAFAYRLQWRHEEARALFAENLERWTAVFGETDRGTLNAESTLATEYWYLGELEEAERRYLAVLEKQLRVLGEDHSSVGSTRHNLALVYDDLGNEERVLELYTQVWESRRRRLGDDHPQTLDELHIVIDTKLRLGRDEGLDTMVIQLYETVQRVLGKDHALTREALDHLVQRRFAAGELEEAYSLKERLLAAERSALGSEQPVTLYNLACYEALAGEAATAIRTLRAAMEAGFTNAKHAVKDADLESLLERPAFVAILEEMKKRGAADPGR